MFRFVFSAAGFIASCQVGERLFTERELQDTKEDGDLSRRAFVRRAFSGFSVKTF
jgi:hypothetical protein